MSSIDLYRSIINLYRLNIELTDDAIRLLDTLVSVFNKTFINVESITQLEQKLRSIFPGATSEILIPQLYNVSRGYLSQENTLNEAKNITIRYVLILILRGLYNKGLIDAYDIAIYIIHDPILKVLRPGLPKFPYEKAKNKVNQPIKVGNITFLAGYLKGIDDYLEAILENFKDANVLQYDKIGLQLGIKDASIDFNNKFRSLMIQKGLSLNKTILGFMDLIDILSN